MRTTLHIESLVAGGDGLARDGGRVIFVPGALPGETVDAEVVEDRGRTWRAHGVRVLEPSPERVAAGCPHFATCGGCAWMHLRPEAQAAAKQEIFYRALAHIGGLQLEAPAARPIVASPGPVHYRVRTTLHLKGGRLGYAQRASHDLVDVRECRVLVEPLEQALLRLKRALAEEGAPPKCGDVNLACDARRVAAAFHVASATPALLARVERLMRRAELDGAVVVPESGPVRTLGKPVLDFPAPHAEGVFLHGRPDLFAQSNFAANALLVGEALEQLGRPASVLELFCGAGNFTFGMASRGARVTAVEIAGESLELARRSGREAGFEGRVRFVAGDSLKVADALAREGQRFEALLLDPPRTGAKGIGPLARRLGARRVVYVSCDPATLARDARELVAEGFRPLAARPVDMFPQTFHVEGVLSLERA